MKDRSLSHGNTEIWLYLSTAFMLNFTYYGVENCRGEDLPFGVKI